MNSSRKRRYKRIQYNLPVGCLGSFEVLEGRTRNISEAGVCLEMDRSLISDLPVSLIFKIPTRPRPFVIPGRMLWIDKDDDSGKCLCGFEYLWLSKDDREALLRFIGVFKDENEETFHMEH